ncbi:MAG: ribosomal protein 3-hydroxylase [Betaproteobacteria bacterium]|jgi:50S ribosomal protein L16 3-hydroxylase|nr:ribosomal protein 3-hydroxylase [Betaproteobacteria bacterium]
MHQQMLGGLAPRAFLARHWQKRPLIVRCAIAAPDLIDERELAALARRDDVESRIVQRRGNRWNTEHGPFARIKASKINWSILVNGVNHHVAAADRLLRRFSFVPQARLDDVMVSYATPGGGVGPHVDSYDVFLIQGAGRRRWRIGRKVFVAGPGDLIYLPPGLEHDGVALEPCFTYSIGFRAPRGVELGAAFLDWLHERGLADARYRDPGLRPGANPGRIPAEMLAFAGKLLSKIRWTRDDVARFLGEYLTQPKPHVVFRPAASRGGWIRLDPKTQLLYSGGRFFINGEAFALPGRDRAAMRELADRRGIAARRLASQSRLIREWRSAGWLRTEKG